MLSEGDPISTTFGMAPQREESKPLEVYSPRTRTIFAMKPHSSNVEMDLISEACAFLETLRNGYCLGKLKIGLSLDRPFSLINAFSQRVTSLLSRSI